MDPVPSSTPSTTEAREAGLTFKQPNQNQRASQRQPQKGCMPPSSEQTVCPGARGHSTTIEANMPVISTRDDSHRLASWPPHSSPSKAQDPNTQEVPHCRHTAPFLAVDIGPSEKDSWRDRGSTELPRSNVHPSCCCSPLTSFFAPGVQQVPTPSPHSLPLIPSLLSITGHFF